MLHVEQLLALEFVSSSSSHHPSFLPSFSCQDMLEFPAQELRKYFKMGDHVKVIAGRFEGDTGLIVRVEENFVILFSDLTMHEVSGSWAEWQPGQEQARWNSVGARRGHGSPQEFGELLFEAFWCCRRKFECTGTFTLNF